MERMIAPPADPSSHTVADLERGALVPALVCSPAMLALLRRVEHVASSQAAVLIIGESGCGKELIATHLHRHSNRRDRPFVVLSCAGVSDHLLETELFGHEQGGSRRIGRLEAANGGTLLLDEIGEMDLRMQARLLRALQQRESDRVSGGSPAQLDVRLVATTSHDLQEDLRRGRFRADLFFRLSVITVKVPPLRMRLADIPALAEFFARHFAQANGLTPAAISPDSMALLLQHGWPGNVRELENVMHRAVLTETGPSITPAALALSAPADEAEPSAARLAAAAFPSLPTIVRTDGRTIEAVEKDMILNALCQCKGNRSKAAIVLGISIRTLRNKLNEFEREGTRIPRPIAGLA